MTKNDDQMNRVEIAARTILGSNLNFVEKRRGVIEDGYVLWMSENSALTFDTLSRLSEAFGTKLIDIEFETGFGGSDVTPADPATFKIFVRRPTLV
jgi:hypothetical protein